MSASDHLSERQFGEYKLSHNLDDTGHHVITATHKGNEVGFLDWYHTGGKIYDIGVKDEHQRKGVATNMYNYAKELSSSDKNITEPRHSETRTDEGDQWARSLGERLPKLEGDEWQ
jgi:ribosomal protein S18 acetylase RimI-like enzyme